MMDPQIFQKLTDYFFSKKFKINIFGVAAKYIENLRNNKIKVTNDKVKSLRAYFNWVTIIK